MARPHIGESAERYNAGYEDVFGGAATPRKGLLAAWPTSDANRCGSPVFMLAAGSTLKCKQRRRRRQTPAISEL